MEQKDIELFTNDYYQILLILEKHEQILYGERFSPLRQQDIAIALHCTSPTANKMVQVLKKQGYIKILMKGRVQLTKKAKTILDKFKCDEEDI